MRLPNTPNAAGYSRALNYASGRACGEPRFHLLPRGWLSRSSAWHARAWRDKAPTLGRDTTGRRSFSPRGVAAGTCRIPRAPELFAAMVNEKGKRFKERYSRTNRNPVRSYLPTGGILSRYAARRTSSLLTKPPPARLWLRRNRSRSTPRCRPPCQRLLRVGAHQNRPACARIERPAPASPLWSASGRHARRYHLRRRRVAGSLFESMGGQFWRAPKLLRVYCLLGRVRRRMEHRCCVGSWQVHR